MTPLKFNGKSTKLWLLQTCWGPSVHNILHAFELKKNLYSLQHVTYFHIFFYVFVDACLSVFTLTVYLIQVMNWASSAARPHIS